MRSANEFHSLTVRRLESNLCYIKKEKKKGQ
jgi:hypothetical protein